MKNNIVLIGFMATGKTAVGRAIAKKLKMKYVSTDTLIERTAKLKISSIFKKFGQEHFRTLETKALRSLLKPKNTVIACGGGIILKEKNRKILRSLGKVFLLKATPETINNRLRKLKQRPLLDIKKDSERMKVIRKILKARDPIYNETAHHAIDTTGLTINKVASKIAKTAGF